MSSKAEIRKRILRLRNAMTREVISAGSDAIVKRLTELAGLRRASTLMVFLSYGSEVFIDDLIRWGWAEGKRIAIGLVRKHRLLERFLVDLLELSWEEVHAEACRLTPVLSDRAGDRLAKLLGDPPTCPHGNSIPSADGALRAEAAIPLHRLDQGKSGVISRIEKEEPELLKYLATLGLLPQTRVEVEEVAPFGGPILIRVGSSRYALGRKVASKILVKAV